MVRFDLPRLGDIRGLRGVHLQCHIGTDTVSLARLGARMTGLDFSAAALAEAPRGIGRALAGADVDFVECATSTTRPSARARIVRPRLHRHRRALLAARTSAAGRSVVADAAAARRTAVHPRGPPDAVGARRRARPDGLLAIEYPYFETDGADASGTRTAPTSRPTSSSPTTVTHEWNHGLGEIVTALLDAGLELTMLEEHDSVPWEALPGQMERIGDGEWRLIDRPDRLPHTYTLQARLRERPAGPA